MIHSRWISWGAVRPVLVLVLALLLMWDAGKPAPWLDEGATILVGRTVSPDTYFLPDLNRYQGRVEGYPTDRTLGSIRLPSNPPLGPVYLVAMAELLGGRITVIRLVFVLAGLAGVLFLMRTLDVLFPRRRASLIFIALVIASAYLFPYLRGVRHYPVTLLFLGLIAWGLTSWSGRRSPIGSLVVWLSPLLMAFAFYPLMPAVSLAVGYVLAARYAGARTDARRRDLIRFAFGLGAGALLVLAFNNHGQALALTRGAVDTTGRVLEPMKLDPIEVAAAMARRLAYITNSYLKLTNAVVLIGALALATFWSVLRHPGAAAGDWRVTLRSFAMEPRWLPLTALALLVAAAALTYSTSEILTNIRYSVGIHVLLLFLMVALPFLLSESGGLAGRFKLPVVAAAFVGLFVLKEGFLFATDQAQKASVYQHGAYLRFLAGPYQGPIDALCEYIPRHNQRNDSEVEIVISYEAEGLAACLASYGVYTPEQWARLRGQELPTFLVPRIADHYPDYTWTEGVFDATESALARQFPLERYRRVILPVRDIGFNLNAQPNPGLLDCSSLRETCTRLYILEDDR